MSDRLKTGTKWLREQASEHMASEITYRAPDVELTLQATQGRTEYEVDDEAGRTVQAHVVDFLVSAEDMEFDPAPGDTITIEGVIYEVMNFAGEGCWRWATAFRETRRIHTREADEEDES